MKLTFLLCLLLSNITANAQLIKTIEETRGMYTSKYELDSLGRITSFSASVKDHTKIWQTTSVTTYTYHPTTGKMNSMTFTSREGNYELNPLQLPLLKYEKFVVIRDTMVGGKVAALCYNINEDKQCLCSVPTLLRHPFIMANKEFVQTIMHQRNDKYGNWIMARIKSYDRIDEIVMYDVARRKITYY